MPRWVLDYVLLHELAHLLHAGHGPEFWAELDAYPRTARARGFLEGYAYARRTGPRGRGGDDGRGRERRRAGRVDADEVDVDVPTTRRSTTEFSDDAVRRGESDGPQPRRHAQRVRRQGSASGSSPRISASARSTSAASSTAVARRAA